jgi:alkaline phosphatase
LVLAAVTALGSAVAGVARPAADSAILFIGDGMGPMQIRLGAAAAGERLAMERMPFSGLATTLALGGEITDSAAAATALATGHKTADGMLSVTPEGRKLETILERCRRAGKSVGIITNDALYGATPAGFAVHVDNRGKRDEIAEQIARSGALVMMGYGKAGFLPQSAGGARKDGKDLVAELRRKGYQVVFARGEMAKAGRQRLVGLFDDDTGPSLPEMVKAAIPRLARNERGFFLVVEQARIDWKEGDPSGVALDAVELDKAVQLALEFAQRRGRILVVVTADHETGHLRVEQPERLSVLRHVKASAYGIAGHLAGDRSNIAAVMAEYAGLSDLTESEISEIKEAKEVGEAIGAVISKRAGIAWTPGHSATPVKVFAFGATAERLTGEMDNTDIPKRMAAALGVRLAEGKQR